MSETKSFIALEILKQLGGNKFLVMTGSNKLIAGENYLLMRLTRNLSGAKFLKILLNGNDTYTMLFFSVDKELNKKIKAERSGVYCEMLQPIFKEVTGLDTHL